VLELQEAVKGVSLHLEGAVMENLTKDGPKPLRAALYARVSTRGLGQTPETQLLPLRKYAADRGFESVKEYVDVGYSGSTDRRPALDRLMSDLRARRIDVIVAWKWDRVFRSTRHAVNLLAECRHLGVGFISLTEQIDLTSPMGEAMFAVISAMSQLERDLIRERVMAGLARARAEGVRLGRPALDVDPARVAEVYAQVKSIRLASQQLSISPSSVQRLLKQAGRSPVLAVGGQPDQAASA
jgi:DNA invertase Pin-like site-specific DNA recombinase